MSIDKISWESVVLVLGVLLVLIAAYNTVMTAVKNHIEAKKRKSEPVNKLDTDVQNHTETLKIHDQMITADRARLDRLEEQSRLTLRALMAMQSHMLDGNHTDNIKASVDEIQNFLVNR